MDLLASGGAAVIAWLKAGVLYVWSRKTTAFGYFVVFLGVIATSSVVPPSVLPWVLLANGMITAGLGHYNNAQLKRLTAADTLPIQLSPRP